MDQKGINACEINQTEKTNTICFHLCAEAKDKNK